MEPLDLARKVVDALEDKKGEDIVLLDLDNLSPITEYFVLVSGSSERTLRGLLNTVAKDLKLNGHSKPRLEGNPDEGWLLADFGSVIVHIFSKSRRDYYALEELWSDAKVLLHVQ